MPQRLLCLSAEAADICARLGAWDRVVGVSAFAIQEGLEPRPVISGFSTCDCERAMRLKPDLVITFSDVQADIAGQFIRAGAPVLATNQRTLAEIAETIRLIGGVIGRPAPAAELAETFLAEIEALTNHAELRPRVYFEEWPDPPISGIGWVGEIIERAGGCDVFAERRGKEARERMVTYEKIVAAQPEIILASWCGKPVDWASIRKRPGFADLSAVRDGNLHTLSSDLILQPGPRVMEGARRIREIISLWRQAQPLVV
ncbi:MAG TPA: ABC transporter substrate-binding protein [Pirellulales bacterium]|jgi:iron complex transport system substrate-binding protein|nr:ABC transporter substrate-binding protein [Pirellulales bacterium]